MKIVIAICGLLLCGCCDTPPSSTQTGPVKVVNSAAYHFELETSAHQVTMHTACYGSEVYGLHEGEFINMRLRHVSKFFEGDCDEIISYDILTEHDWWRSTGSAPAPDKSGEK